MGRLQDFVAQPCVEFKSLIDGGIITQWSFVPKGRTPADLQLAQSRYKDKDYKIERNPTPEEYEDLLFGWLVESGITSNSVIYVRDQVTVGIGTGEQDRVGVAQIARDKAYRKLADQYCYAKYGNAYHDLTDKDKIAEINAQVAEQKGGLKGATMVSDAFFPFRDGIDVGLQEGVRAVIQPGGAINDYQCIEACNEVGATMVFTGQRSFKH
jgi:phosphoribosylaminoimidazolecarboxamide formyltransferase/IMP cyclohydrolase